MKTPVSYLLAAALLPAPALAQSPYAHDLAVTHIYALDKVAQADATPQVVRARVVNRGTQTVSGAVVRLRVSGANAFVRTGTISLPAGYDGVVSFGAYPPGARGRQRLSARVPADDNPANDSVQVAQVVSADTASYATPGVPNYAPAGQFIFGGRVNGVGNQFPVGSVPRQIRAVRAFVTHPYSVGLVVEGFVADRQTGRVLGRSAQSVITPSDINRYQTFYIADDVVLQNRDYLAGYFVVGRVGPSPPFEPIPWGYQLDVPQRSEVTYDVAYTLLGNTPPVPPLDFGRLATLPDTLAGKFMAEVITAAPPACARPANLQVVVRGGPFRVEFDSTYNAVGYDVAYGPAGFDPDRATATAGRVVQQRRGPFWLTANLPNTSYTFFARARCAGGGVGAWVGPVEALSPCDSQVTRLPYRESFDHLRPGQPWPCGSRALDADGNRTTWTVVDSIYSPPNGYTHLAASAPNALYLDLLNGNYPAGGRADDWFFTPGLALRAGHRYRLDFRYRSLGILNSPDKLAVWLGDAPDPARQTVLLFRNPQVSSYTYIAANAGTTPAVQDIRVPADGFYYLGFQAFSQLLSGVVGNGALLLLDDLEVAEATTTPTQAATPTAALALDLHPNPSADGRCVLELPRTAGAGLWSVRVTNAVGQTVAQADDWAAGPHLLDLHGRPPGLYAVRACGPAGCLTRHLVVGP